MTATIRNLVFEGGGVWGMAYEGVLGVLGERGVLDGVERVAGASAGAITACLLAVGYSAAEVGRVVRATNFREFEDDTVGFARDTARLLTEYGWFKGEVFKQWIRARIAEKAAALSRQHGVKGLPARPTFSDLTAWHRRLANKGVALPALYMVGTNLSKQRREIYSAEHTRSLKVEDAVRRSMSIPIFFACARGANQDVLVDGGLTWNYPVNLFDHTDYLSDPANGKPVNYANEPGFVFNTETLGFRLDTTDELKWNLKDWHNEPVKIDNFIHYGWALITMMRAVANKIHLHQNDWSRTVFVDVGKGVGFTDFDLTEAQKNTLSEAGRAGVVNYFRWRDSKKGGAELAKMYAKMAPEKANRE